MEIESCKTCGAFINPEAGGCINENCSTKDSPSEEIFKSMAGLCGILNSPAPKDLTTAKDRRDKAEGKDA